MARSGAHMGVYVNESGTLGDIAIYMEISGVEDESWEHLHSCSINSLDDPSG